MDQIKDTQDTKTLSLSSCMHRVDITRSVLHPEVGFMVQQVLRVEDRVEKPDRWDEELGTLVT